MEFQKHLFKCAFLLYRGEIEQRQGQEEKNCPLEYVVTTKQEKQKVLGGDMHFVFRYESVKGDSLTLIISVFIGARGHKRLLIVLLIYPYAKEKMPSLANGALHSFKAIHDGDTKNLPSILDFFISTCY